MDQTTQEIAKTIQERFGLEQQTFRDQLTLIASSEKIMDVMRALKTEFGFNFLADETAVDYWPQEEPRYHIIYQVRDLSRMLHLSLRVPLNGDNPHIPTMEGVYSGANWFERELWDMFGIVFDGHSDLRRIIMPFDWQGHPLRKDYPLGYEEVQFTFNANDIQMRKPHPKE